MAHLPVNHPARGVYRVIATAIGLYILLFGILGLVETWGRPFFDQSDTWALGLRTNPAFSVLSILVGAMLVGAVIYGHNVDHFLHLWGGIVFLVAGVVMMAVLHTAANILNFAVINSVVSFIIGTLLLLAGLYGKEGSPELEQAEAQLRHGELGAAQLAEQSGQPADVEAQTDVRERRS